MPEPTSTGATRSTVQLEPMHVPKASDVLADDLRARILRGDFPEGTALPPERELVLQTNMSRTTVREALRILEVQGLVRIKTGRSGGAFVKRPGEESLANSVSLLIQGGKIRMTSLLETREALEPACAQLAAKYRDDDDLDRLEAANTAIENSDSLDAFLGANVDWHVGVALASHNELLIGFMRAISAAIYTATNNQGFVDDEVRGTAVRAHHTITDAIRAQDSAAAVRRMQRHVHSYAEAVLQVEDRTQIDVTTAP